MELTTFLLRPQRFRLISNVSPQIPCWSSPGDFLPVCRPLTASVPLYCFLSLVGLLSVAPSRWICQQLARIFDLVSVWNNILTPPLSEPANDDSYIMGRAWIQIPRARWDTYTFCHNMKISSLNPCDECFPLIPNPNKMQHYCVCFLHYC